MRAVCTSSHNMQQEQVMIVLCLGLCWTIHAKLCTGANKEIVGRVVFGEARGESADGQLAVAWTIVNRVNHAGYPNTLPEVVYAKNGIIHEYNTLDSKKHDKAWESAEAAESSEFTDAIAAADGALCNSKADPTKCAVSFCAKDPCSATASNKWWVVYCDPSVAKCPQQIGSHYFVCRKKAT